ncbi:MAG: hypothetical protein QXT53_07135 [Ignisphaera sp.]
MVSSLSGIVEGLRSRYRDVNCAIACVSGGVDSTVAAIIAKIAFGDKVYPVFIDTGFMRIGEGLRVKEYLKNFLDIEIYDFSEQIISRVEGLEDAEEKRKAFRDAFYRAVKAVTEEKGCEWVVQGTIKADVVETIGGVKTQHNVLNEELLKRYGLRVIEPLINLYKHEVGNLPRSLDYPNKLLRDSPSQGQAFS